MMICSKIISLIFIILFSEAKFCQTIAFSVRQEEGWSDDRPSLETVKSVDELLELLYPEYGLLQQCLRRKAHRSALASSYPSFPDPSASPLVYTDDEDVWAHSRKEALYKMDGTLEGKSNHSGRVLHRPFHKCQRVF